MRPFKFEKVYKENCNADSFYFNKRVWQ